MDDSSEKVSVLMSVYNGSQYLRKAIESILHQTFSNFEFIIINDCSTDSSGTIIQEYADKDRRIKLVENTKNIGLTKSLNKGLALAKGKYIARQDADDVSLPKRLEKQVAFLDACPDCVLVSCNIQYIDGSDIVIGEDGRSCNSGFIPWYLLFYNHIAGHSQVVFRRRTVASLGGYCEARQFSQDYELWSRLSRAGKIHIIDETLVQQRRHTESLSSRKSVIQKELSLGQSVSNIKRMVNKDITLEEALVLREFWTGNMQGFAFPSIKNAVLVCRYMKSIYPAYLVKANRDREFSEKLKTAIQTQFNHWISAESKLPYGFLRRLLLSACINFWYTAP